MRSTISIRIDAERKRLAQLKARKRGLTLTEVIEHALEAFLNDPMKELVKLNICDKCQRPFQVQSRLERYCPACKGAHDEEA